MIFGIITKELCLWKMVYLNDSMKKNLVASCIVVIDLAIYSYDKKPTKTSKTSIGHISLKI